MPTARTLAESETIKLFANARRKVGLFSTVRKLSSVGSNSQTGGIAKASRGTLKDVTTTQ